MADRLVLTVLPLALTVLPVAFTPPCDLAIPAVSPFTLPLSPSFELRQAYANSSDPSLFSRSHQTSPLGLHPFTFVHATSSVVTVFLDSAALLATLLTLCA